jgi:diguanylate cyclase (GGDEF)-like protein/PAS domain S-box-containing protein
MSKKANEKELEKIIKKNNALVQSLKDQNSDLKKENEVLFSVNEDFAGQVNTLTVESEISRLEFIQVFDAVSDPLWIMDKRHTILRVNKSFVDLFQLESKTDVVGKKCYEILNNSLCRTNNCFLKNIKNNKGRIEVETTLNIGNKSDSVFLLTGAPLIGVARETIGAVVQLKDISKRKAYEETLKISNKELEELASVDALTQIPNRRMFDLTLQKEWRRMKRSQQPITLLMIDIDYFKLYNDNYGHAKGDECLRQLAGTINSCVHRSHDLAARYGGEEFSCILAETDLKGAATVADSILNAIRDRKILHEYSPIADFVTASIGCCCMVPGSNDKPGVLISNADELLYKSKESGRNKVTKNK